MTDAIHETDDPPTRDPDAPAIDPVDLAELCEPGPAGTIVLAILSLDRNISGRLDRLNSRLDRLAATVHLILESMHKKHIHVDGSPATPWPESKGGDEHEENDNQA